ncbi:hypothetical protein [Flavobacterium sp. KACC 22763]|uniref:hypothetical protein n=1 Tax=Flavobacterium sp. KACC 22763 TaxID=3025668 RepID=UPI0023672DD3|nr:hypothetical protein [Flavobacterium sp. KACC 22763]WDF63174.1 hypothetical protein PQ463_16325 [Flavobacterium sp. KACC 22763]
MVTIINFKERQTEEGKIFFVLEAQGGIEMIQSKVTGNFYATAKKAFIPATFDEATCKALIGTQMQGQIIKEECDPYEYVNKESGEVIMMSHRYVYKQEEIGLNRGHEPFGSFGSNQDVFSKNGKFELEHA